MKKVAFKGITFIVLLTAILIGLNSIFIKKVGHRAKLHQGLYEKENSYNVLLMGSSHMNSSLNPNILWGKYGITSFNYGTGGQPIDVTYYLLEEALKTHNPEIVVVDLYYLGLEAEYGQEGYIRYVLDNMKFSLNKINAIMNSTPEKDRFYYYFPLGKYHIRWNELTKEDFFYDMTTLDYSKGFSAGREIYGVENLGDADSELVGEIPLKSEKYLYKFIELAKTKGFKLIFTNAPYDYTSTDGIEEWYKDDAAMFNRIAMIAEENDIPFINYASQEMMDKIAFNFAEDMYNVGHLNIWGSTKITLDFADFLHENYRLLDYRDDANYKDWNEDYNEFIEGESAL